MAIQTTIEVLRIPGTLFPRGAFDENASYKFLNIVESGGSGYVCLQPCTGIPVTNTAYWFKFCFKGDKGDAFTYADLTAEQKAELVRDATAAAQAAASSAQSAADDAAAALQKFNTIKAAIDALDPTSTEGSIQTLAAKQGLLESELDALGPEISKKVVKSGGENLIDPSTLTKDKGIYANTTNGNLSNLSGGEVSDFIPVNGKNIITNAFFSAYWGGAVYDSSKQFIRALGTAQYTYQEGDAYIRVTFDSSKVGKEKANYGTTLTTKEYNPIEGYLGELTTEVNQISTDLQNETTSLHDADLNKVDKSCGENIADPSQMTADKGIYAGTTDGKIRSFSGGEVSGFIPVNGQSIITNGFFSAYWGGAVYDADKNFLRALSTAQYTYQSGDAYIRVTFDSSTIGNEKASYGTTLTTEPYNPLHGYLVEVKATEKGLRDDVTLLQDSFKNEHLHTVADGKFIGKERLLFVNDSDKAYIGKETMPFHKKNVKAGRNIICTNHDDLFESDYLGVGKIYAKYGFRASFTFILKPFSSLEHQSSMIDGVKDLIKNGNDIGLHAIFDESAWWANKMFDVRPNSSSTFAPTLSELQTIVANGKNVFGKTISSTTKLSSAGYLNPPSDLANVNVLELTNAQMISTNVYYCVFMFKDTETGLDLDGNVQTWSKLKWLEYWYNELIDDSLGYTNTSESFLARFIADYDCPVESTELTSATASAYNAYYPDVEHLLNGKIVFYDDTTNPNYNNTDYQKVGRFARGLFKGCASCCNYEVIDRLIAVAAAFCKHYFGLDQFRNMNRHGVRFVDAYWRNADGVPYDNRGLSVITGEVGKVFRTRTQEWVTEHDMLLEAGIRMQNHCTPRTLIFEAQQGLWFGQWDKHSPFFNYCDVPYGNTGYLAFVGYSSSYSGYNGNNVSYSDYTTFVEGIEDITAFAYDNAGTSVTRNGVMLYVYPHIKDTIDAICAAMGTNKIAAFSWDTINADCSTMAAVDAILSFCYRNGIEVVTPEEARQIVTSNDVPFKKNFFPNSSFTQSKLSVGTTDDADLPDGWFVAYKPSGASLQYSVTANRELVVSANGSPYLGCKVFGLPAGQYTLSYYAKRTGAVSCRVKVFVKKNGDYVSQYYYNGASHFEPISNIKIEDAEYVKQEVVIDIPDPYVTQDDGSVEYAYSKGHQDNVSNVMLRIDFSSASTDASISIKDIRLV